MKYQIRNKLIVLVFTLLSGHAFAQNSFVVNYSSNLEDEIIQLIEDDNNGFLAVGFKRDMYNAGFDKGIIIKISPDGDTVVKTYKNNDTAWSFYQICKSFDNNYYIFGFAASPPEYYHDLLILKIDSELNVLESKCFDFDELSNYPMKVVTLKFKKGFYLLSQTFSKDLERRTLVCRLDKNCDTLKTKIIFDLGNHQEARDFFLSRNSSEIHIFGEGFYFPDCSRVVCDTNFNIIHSSQFSDFINSPVNVKWYTDSTLILAGKYLYYDNNPQHDDILITETDTSFSNMSYKLYGAEDTINYPAWVRTFDFNNKDSIFLCGTHNVIFGFYPHGVSWISVMQLDSNLNPRSEVFIGGDAYYSAYNILSTSDGGCLISATRYDYTAQDEENDIFIVKLSREDIITKRDELSPGIIDEEFNVYPNPFNENLYIDAKHTGSLFRLFNINGSIVLEFKIRSPQTRIYCSGLSPGSYYYSIISNKKIVESAKLFKL